MGLKRQALRFLCETLVGNVLASAGEQIGESVGKRIGRRIYIEPEKDESKEKSDGG